MSLLEKASLIVTPNAYKESKLYSVVPSDGAGDMTVVRATTATRVNSVGLIESVAVNIPRINYSNGSCPSLLVEPQRTNLLLNSATVSTQTITTTATPTTLSFYGTGTITITGTYSGSLIGTGVNNRVYLTFTPSIGALILTISGSCTNGQLEAGSYATSYIPTVASAVTRNADVISKTGISSLIGQTEGTMFCEIKNIADDNIEKHITISDGTNNNIVDLYYGFWGSGSIYCGVKVAGTTGGLLVGALNVTNMNKIAVVYKTNRFELWINGSKMAEDLIGTTFSGTTLSKLETAQNGANTFFGNINSIQLYKTALSSTELAQLTTI